MKDQSLALEQGIYCFGHFRHCAQSGVRWYFGAQAFYQRMVSDETRGSFVLRDVLSLVTENAERQCLLSAVEHGAGSFQFYLERVNMPLVAVGEAVAAEDQS